MLVLVRFLLLSILLVCSTIGCLKTFPVLADPPAGEDGLVAFGLIVAKGGLSKGIFDGFENSDSRYTKISPAHDLSRFITMTDEGKDIEGDGNVRFHWVERLKLGETDDDPVYFVATRLPPNKPLLISGSSRKYLRHYSYTTSDKYGNVHHHSGSVVDTEPVAIEYDDLQKKKFAFTNPGTRSIRFLGNFIAHPPEWDKKSEAKPAKNYVLTGLNEYILREPVLGAGLKRKYYGQEEITETGAEIFFLKRFIVENRSRYWEDIAINRLLKLDPKMKERVSNARIAIPKEESPIQTDPN